MYVSIQGCGHYLEMGGAIAPKPPCFLRQCSGFKDDSEQQVNGWPSLICWNGFSLLVHQRSWVKLSILADMPSAWSKSTGLDGISAKMLKGTVDAIVPSLTRLFNLFLTTGTFPKAWKLARIVPVPKSVNMSAPSNYRPISILSVVSKLLERHVHHILFEFLSTNYHLSMRQWGFLRGWSSRVASHPPLPPPGHQCILH